MMKLFYSILFIVTDFVCWLYFGSLWISDFKFYSDDDDSWEQAWSKDSVSEAVSALKELHLLDEFVVHFKRKYTPANLVYKFIREHKSLSFRHCVIV